MGKPLRFSLGFPEARCHDEHPRSAPTHDPAIANMETRRIPAHEIDAATRVLASPNECTSDAARQPLTGIAATLMERSYPNPRECA